MSFEVLRRVESGAYASDLLAHARGLDARDAGLATEIVFGCLRYQAQLDYMISRLTNNRTLDSEVQIVLRMGMYQMRYLERIPPHAAVSESVDLIKRGGKASAAPLVNAVLRKVNRNPVIWPDRATELSCPEWLLGKWERQFGKKTAEQMARAFLTPPENYVATTGRIQDIGSQSIVPLLDLQPGQTFLDLCAAPGNKTAQALQLGVEAWPAISIRAGCAGLDDLACHRVALDATQPLPFARQFDRILVDAPCSGTGRWRRNPEIKWRLPEATCRICSGGRRRSSSRRWRIWSRAGRWSIPPARWNGRRTKTWSPAFPGPGEPRLPHRPGATPAMAFSLP